MTAEPPTGAGGSASQGGSGSAVVTAASSSGSGGVLQSDDAGPDGPAGPDGMDDAGADAGCVTCSQAMKDPAVVFDPSTQGRTYEGACPGSAALWATFYDSVCQSSTKPCFVHCSASFCQTGFTHTSDCADCIAMHVTEPPYDFCAAD